MNGNVEDAEDAFFQITLKAWDQLFIHAIALPIFEPG
jgi:hypothetical protein